MRRIPALPTGLTVAVNASTCRITGTPTATQALTTHTITATAADGSTDTATVDVTVNAANPPIIADAAAQVYATTVAISPLSFTNTGAAAVSCSVLPALPTGLAVAVNASTCRITGTPTATQALTTHTITATAADGSIDTATVDVTVNAANPPNLANAASQTYVTTVPIAPLSFTNTGAAAVSCSVLPALPTGLTLAVNTSTCQITGTPTTTQALTTHTITATASDGSFDTATVDVTVNAANPPNLANAASPTYVTTVAISPLSFTNSGAAAVSCSVLPALPTGLSVAVNASTCQITGTATASQALTTHTVTATGADGSIDTATIDVTVNAANPPNLANASAQTYTTLVAISPLSFTNTGAAAVSCSVLPALPSGLGVAVNSSTCRVSGTPTVTQAATTHTITATAADGSVDTATVDITVLADAAEDCVWNGSVSTAWSDSSNWSTCGGGVPTANDTIRIPAAPANQPTLSASTTIASVASGVGGGVVRFAANTSITMSGTVDSSIRFYGAYSVPPAIIVPGTMTISSGVTVTVGYGANVNAASIVVDGTFVSYGNLTVTTSSGITVNSGGELNYSGGLHTTTDVPAIAISANATLSALYASLTYAVNPTSSAILVTSCTGIVLPAWAGLSFDYTMGGGGHNIDISGSGCSSIPMVYVQKYSNGGASFGASFENDPESKVRWSMDCVWTGATDQAWTTGSNWTSCGGVSPVHIDTIRVPSAPINQPLLSASQEISEIAAGSGGGKITVAAGAKLTFSYARSDITFLGDTATCTTCTVGPPANHFATYANVKLEEGITFDSTTAYGSFGVYAGGRLTINSAAYPQIQWPRFKKIEIYVYGGRLDINGLYMTNDTVNVRVHLNGLGAVDRFDNVQIDKHAAATDPAIRIDGCNSVSFNDTNWTGVWFNGVFPYNISVSAPCSSGPITVETNGTGGGSAYENDPTNFVTWNP